MEVAFSDRHAETFRHSAQAYLHLVEPVGHGELVALLASPRIPNKAYKDQIQLVLGNVARPTPIDEESKGTYLHAHEEAVTWPARGTHSPCPQ